MSEFSQPAHPEPPVNPALVTDPESEVTVDPQLERTLRLLWRHTVEHKVTDRGPKPKASTDEIVQTAIELADETGISGLTMRNVAEKLGLGVMTLYGYVPGRNELLGLMIDQVAGESGYPEHQAELGDRLLALAENLWQEYQRHPWLVDVRLPRPWIGPHISNRYEWQLHALEGFGFDDMTMDQIVTLIDAYVAGAARNWVAEQERLLAPNTDLDWWIQTDAVLQELMGETDYPISSRVGSFVGELYGLGQADQSYRFGLERIIESVLRLLPNNG